MVINIAQPGSLRCVICNGSSRPDKVLSDGRNYHQSCYEELLKEWQDLNDVAFRLNSSLLEIKHRRSRLETEISSIFSLFRRGSLNKELKEVRLSVAKYSAASERATEDVSKFDVSRLESLWDFWLTYPPDWETRRSEFLDGERCEDCKTSKGLQVHHITPLSKGGSNLMSNFSALCRECHEDHHHGFKDGGRSGSLLSRHLSVITNAINNKSKVAISYKAKDKEKTKRIILPIEFVTLEFRKSEGVSLCVRAFCELRGSERVFAIRRITNAQEIP